MTPQLDRELIARVSEVRRLTPTIVEVIVHAPAAARQFQPGQFYRLQNYETHARRANGTRLLMEGIALTGAWVDREKGLLSLIALELGVSSRLCALSAARRTGRRHGTRQERQPRSKRTRMCCLPAADWAMPFCSRSQRECARKGNRVIYFAGYKKGEDLFKREEIEAATDQVIWSTDIGAAIEPRRPQDRHFRGNIVQAMLAYGRGELGEPLVPLIADQSHYRHRLRPDDGGRERCAARRSSAAAATRITSPSRASTHRCSA